MLNKNTFDYAAMLNITGQNCVIIGGGSVAARKLTTLGEAGAMITIVAPEFCSEALNGADKYSCNVLQEHYRPEHLKGAFITIAATDCKEINREITAAAPFLVNNITEPELSNFIVPASMQVGEIKLTIATGGIPAYTRFLKSFLKQKLTPAFAEFNEFLKEQRQQVKNIPSTPAERTAFWRQALSPEVLNLLENNDVLQAKEKVQYAVNSFRAQSQNGTSRNPRTL